MTRAEFLHSFQRVWCPKPFCGALSICVLLCCEAQAQSCTDIFGAIRREAMYCGFFCDEGTLMPLQKAYETKCIRLVLPPSAFDLDSRPHELTLLDRRNGDGASR